MKKALKTLELNKILEQLAGHASFSAGMALARALQPENDLELVQHRIAETTESCQLLEIKPETGVGGARDVRSFAERAGRGVTLQPQDLLDVLNTLQSARRLRRSILHGDVEFPLLARLANGISECQDLCSAIETALDDQGVVLDSASPKLAKLRRETRIIRDRIQDRLQRILNSDSAQYLQEPLISQRGGRWVVPLQASFKGRIRGIVHDQSASGATLWVEPMGTVDLNNQYREVLLAEEQEVQRILAELSALVAEHGDRIRWTVESLAALDLNFAKAKYAFALDAVPAEMLPFRPGKGLHPGSSIRLIQARHPLLDPTTVVPIDVELEPETYLVIITGPNTGGKTVSLKTVGLLTLMAQCGLHLPCREASLSVFDAVYADIGDEQSIEQSLSTFSGHLTNVVDILNHADERSLVILDELGAGTDPSEGSALARAILTYLRDKGVTTFVATHYPELKLYAHDLPEATNASVEFDLESLAPTYRLRVGLAGRSNAFAIAGRLGLEPDIIQAARDLISDTELKAEDLLASIHRARDEAESELLASQRQRMATEREQEALEERLRQIDLERLRVLQDARIAAEEEVAAFRDELRQLRRQLSAAGQPLTEIRKMEEQAKELEREAAAKPERRPANETTQADRPRRMLQVGDTVWVTTLRVEGEILAIDGDEADVQIGRLRTRANLQELEWRRSKKNAKPEYAGSAVRHRSTARVELDIRGQRVENALLELDAFLDAALLGSAPWVRIIHGKGTGALRTAVRQALKSQPHVSRFEDGKDGEGGWGVTVAYLADH